MPLLGVSARGSLAARRRRLVAHKTLASALRGRPGPAESCAGVDSWARGRAGARARCGAAGGVAALRAGGAAGRRGGRGSAGCCGAGGCSGRSLMSLLPC